jgi:DNA-directed RNA polymerase beta subunit
LPTGVLKLAKVYIAKKRKLKVGDKLAGRHGNKGIVSKNCKRVRRYAILEDGTPVDIVLNPLGCTFKDELRSDFETVLGWAGKKIGMNFATPILTELQWMILMNISKSRFTSSLVKLIYMMVRQEIDSISKQRLV